MKRHLSNVRSVFKYRDKILANCPNCGALALISAKNIKYDFPISGTEDIRVTCTKCSFNKNASTGYWQGPVIGTFKVPCQKCGHQWIEKTVSKNNTDRKLPETAKATCPACSFVNTEKLKWSIDSSLNQGTDPYFGLPLWLKADFKGNLLWAFNLEHLKELQDYVAADLRERLAYPSKWTMTSRLPKWIKNAKNRTEVLKIMEDLRSTAA